MLEIRYSLLVKGKVVATCRIAHGFIARTTSTLLVVSSEKLGVRDVQNNDICTLLLVVVNASAAGHLAMAQVSYAAHGVVNWSM